MMEKALFLLEFCGTKSAKNIFRWRVECVLCRLIFPVMSEEAANEFFVKVSRKQIVHSYYQSAYTYYKKKWQKEILSGGFSKEKMSNFINKFFIVRWDK